METEFLMDKICSELMEDTSMNDDKYIELLEHAEQLLQACRSSFSSEKERVEIEFLNAISMSIISQRREHIQIPQVFRQNLSVSQTIYRQDRYFSLNKNRI